MRVFAPSPGTHLRKDRTLGHKYEKSNMTTTLLEITGMSCENCVNHVENALKALAGVKAVGVDLHSGRATVDHEGVDEQRMVEAISEEGYDARVIPPAAEVNRAPVPPTH